MLKSILGHAAGTPLIEDLPLDEADRLIFDLIRKEETRQEEGVELIASENYISTAVMQAMGTVLNNRYSEGYPGDRYYGGQEFMDQIENAARDRAKALFRAQTANVQPHAGAPANLATYFALAKPGDTILGMDLSHGGHLTHGAPVTHPAKIFRFERYKMADVETGRIDYDAVRDIARAVRPRILLAGYSSYPRELDYAVLADIAREVDAIAVADVAHIGGLIAAGEMDNPFDHGFDVVLTTTHKTLRGPRGGMILTADAKLGAKIDKAVFPGLQGGPIMQMVAAKAVSFKEAAQPLFKDYAAAVRVNAKAMAAQLLADGVKLVTGGTDNHLIMLDCVASFGRNGLELQTLLDEAGITVNKNVIPDDVNGAKAPSGIRLGSPAMTTRGAGEEDFRQIARWICELGRNGDASTVRRIKDEVTAFSRALPVPGDRLRAPAAG